MRYGKKTIGNSTVITSSGIAGWGYPIKIGAPSEYAYIKVR
jgi:predicted MPP superfamily phosphohydrolase